jgi:glycosyltransferase involved in cell wall biosynthesis
VTLPEHPSITRERPPGSTADPCAGPPSAAGPEVGYRPRVAMFVMNPCHNDARVRKEAASLGAAGYDVRVFALANSQWPAGVALDAGFLIHRLAVVSRYQRAIAWLARKYNRGPSGLARDSRGRRNVGFSVRRPTQVALAPAVLVWWLVAHAATQVARMAAGTSRQTVRAVQASAPRLGLGQLRQQRAFLLLKPFGSFARPIFLLIRRTRRAIVIIVRRMRRATRVKLHRIRAVGRGVRQSGRRRARRRRATLRRTRQRSLARRRRVLMRVRRLRRRVRRRVYLWLSRFIRRRLLILHRPSVFSEFWRASADAAADWNPDVLHAHDLNALPAAFRTRRLCERALPVVYDSHELWRHRNRVTGFHPVGRLFDAIQERRLIRHCDVVITVSAGISRWLQETYRLPSSRVEVVRNVPWKQHPASGPSLRELAGLGRERILLYTGRITSGRGLEEAIASLPHLPSELVLVMLGYGDSDYLHGLRQRAEALGVERRLHVVPPVDSEQVPAVAASADLALVAIQPLCLSYRLALPNKLFEAIQAGLPVVATDLPEIAAVVRSFELGELYSPGDAEGFRDAVMRLLENPVRYRVGAAQAAGELCWENEIAVLLKAYASHVRLPAPPSWGLANGA